MEHKKYKIERRVFDFSKWWQKSNKVAYWCLIEYGTRWFYYNTGRSVDIDDITYEKIIMKSEDYFEIKKELDFHNGIFPSTEQVGDNK